MKCICCECGKEINIWESYCFRKPNGETVLGHRDCIQIYSVKHNNEIKNKTTKQSK